MTETMLKKGIRLLALAAGLLMAINTASFAAINFNVDTMEQEIASAIKVGTDPSSAAKDVVLNTIKANVKTIEAEIASAVAGGADPKVAAQDVLDSLVQAIVIANPNYPGGLEALQIDIEAALAYLKIAGLEDDDLFVSPEAYETAGRAIRTPETTSFGTGGKPEPGSPT